MNGNKVYLVYAEYDNGESCEDHIFESRIDSVCSTKEIAAERVNRLYEELLQRSFIPYRRLKIPGDGSIEEHEVVAEDRQGTGYRFVVVNCKDGTYGSTDETGTYYFRAVERELDKFDDEEFL